MKDASAELRILKWLRVRGGHFKLPLSPEFLTPAAKIDFIERTLLASSLSPGRDWGAMVQGEVGERAPYQAGLFKGDGRRDRFRAGTTVAARVVVTALDDLDLGASFTLAEWTRTRKGRA